MKAVLILLLAIAVSAQYTVADLDTPFEDFFAGFFNGIKETGNPNDFVKCIGDLTDFKNRIEEGINYIILLTYADVYKGITIIAKAVKDLYAKIEKCFDKFPRIQKLIDAITKTEIMELVVRLINGSAVYIQYFVIMLNAFNSNDFVTVGRYAGRIAIKLYLKEDLLDLSSPTNTTEAFIIGFLKGLGETKSPDDLLKCIKSLEPIIKKIIEALEIIKKGGIQNITTGIKMFLAAIRDILVMAKPCVNGYTVIQNLILAIQQANINDIIIKVISNIQRLILDIDYAVNGFFSGDYKRAGQGIGDILKFIFLD